MPAKRNDLKIISWKREETLQQIENVGKTFVMECRVKVRRRSPIS